MLTMLPCRPISIVLQGNHPSNTKQSMVATSIESQVMPEAAVVVQAASVEIACSS